MQNWRRSKKPTTDAFDELALNPLEEYKVRTFRCSLQWKLTASSRIELLDNGRIHDRNGPYQTLFRDRIASGQSAEDSQGYKKVNRHGLDAECPQAP